MNARYARRRTSTLGAALGVVLLAGGCASQPSIGPNTATGVPGHVDGGAGQVLRFCETLHDAGDLTTAAAMCERAHHLEPSRPEPLLELASILGDMGESDLSKQAYRTALRTAPENAAAHYGLGRIYLDEGQHDLALAEFQAALRGGPRDPRYHNAVGIAHGLLGAHAEAQRVYRAGLLIAPEDRALRNNLGLSLVQAGRYDQGLSVLDALDKDPRAEQASRENLQLAKGLAAAARAEALMAQARAEAEAKAAAEAEARMAPGAATAPAIPVSYPQSAWPMDGPGVDGMTPVGALADKSGAEEAGPGAEAQAAESALLDRREARKRAAAASLAEPTPLTKAMIAPPARRAASSPQESAAPEGPKDPAQPAQSPPPLVRPTGPQTARADVDGASDTNMSAGGTGDVITWTVPREIVDEPPTPLAKAPAQPAMQAAKPPAAQVYAVQFASYTSEERAWRGWDTLRAEVDELLSDVEPNVRRADLGSEKGVFYRLQTAPGEKTRAETLCETLKARGIHCLVVKTEPKMAGAGGPPATL